MKLQNNTIIFCIAVVLYLYYLWTEEDNECSEVKGPISYTKYKVGRNVTILVYIVSSHLKKSGLSLGDINTTT